MIDPERARNQAEAAFKRKEDARVEGLKAMEEYKAGQRAMREKTARLMLCDWRATKSLSKHRFGLLVGAPGFDPGGLQQSAAPVYKTEPHASADAVVIGVAGFEPATSSFRTIQAALHSGNGALSVSSCLTRCITAQIDRGVRRAQSPRPTKSGVPGIEA